jgi:hypothetical protein
MTWRHDLIQRYWTDGKVIISEEVIYHYSRKELQKEIYAMGGSKMSDAMFGYTRPQHKHEHFQFCIDRAYEYLDAGDAQGAFGSFVSDMKKHPDTENRIDPFIAMIGMMEILKGVDAVRRWIDGFPSP